MSAEAIRLLAELNTLGISVWAEQGQLRFRAPKGRLTEPLKAELAARRDALLALLDKDAAAETAIVRRDMPAGQPVPLSPQQHSVWMAEQNGGGHAFLIPGALSLRGALDVDALRAALQALVNRHEALRCAIRLVDDVPMQVALPDVRFELPLTDLSAQGQAGREASVAAQLAAEAEQAFDLATPPLLRARLLRLAADNHVLILTPHHIMSDGWSIDIMVRELSRLYRPDSAPADLGPVPLGYPDFALWQDARRSQGGDRADLDYWRRALADLPAPLELPSDRAAAPDVDFAGAELHAELPAATANGLRQLAKQSGTTLFSALAAAFAALLHRYTGETDLTLGTAIAGRSRAELQDVIGLFAGRLPLRLDLDGNPSFLQLLRRVAGAAAEAFSHAEVPAERILAEAVAPDARPALFQVMIALQNAVKNRLDFIGLEVQPLPIAGHTAKFELFLAVDEADDRLALALEYSTARFDQPAMRQLLNHLVRLAAAAVAAPELPLSELAMLDADERRALLAPPRSPKAWDGAGDLWRRFLQAADAHPERPALTLPAQWQHAGPDAVLSYGALRDRAQALAGSLRRAGVRPGEIVALAGDRSGDFIVGMLAILAAGGGYMPLAPDLPPSRVQEMLEDSGAARLVFSDDAGAALAGSFAAAFDARAAANGDDGAELPAIDPASPAYVMFTSGSTGRPKGVVVSHANALHFVANMPTTPGSGREVFLQFAPSGFDASVIEIWSALLIGARLVIAPPGLPSLDALAELIESRGVNVCWLTAGLFHQMCEAHPAALSRLDYLLSGGDRLSVAAARAVLAQNGPARVYNAYGPTETTVFATLHRILPADVGPDARSVPLGGAHGDARLYILDSRREPVPAGAAGELYIGGAGVSAGYINRPDLTAERFLPDPFNAAPGARMYRSGDLVRRRADGLLEFMGRADRQVKIRGFRIEPAEIEAHLQEHPAISQAAVEPQKQGGIQRLVAYVVASAPLSLDDIRDFLAERLPEHMIPGALVALDALPLTRNGKLDRRALPQPAVESSAGQEPASAEARLLAAIWRDVLQAERIGLDDNFYELGGDSIMAMQVAMRLTRQEWELRPQDMLRHPTLRAQSRLLRRKAKTLARREFSQPLPLTPIQNWFFQLPLANRNHWNQALRLALEPAAAERLETALAALEQTHDALRLRFSPDAGGWRQLPAAAASPRLRRERVAGEEQAGERIAAAQRSLDIEHGPVWAALLLEGLGDWPQLVLIAHHLVVDGVSWRILLEDLALALQGRALTPPALGLCDWAAHLAEQPEAEQAAAEAAPALPPLDHPQGGNLESQTAIASLLLPPDAATQLLGPANAPYRTEPTELLLAAIMLGLRDAFGRDALTVALERHGREADGIDLSGTVGWFTAIAAVRLDLAAAQTPGQALLAVKQAARTAPRRMRNGDGRAPAVAFNYLGRFDNTLPPGGPFRPLDADSGVCTDPAGARPYALEIVASVDADGLRVDFRHSAEQFERATIAAWVDAARANLLALAALADAETAGGRAPCDFPLSGIASQRELDDLLAEHQLAAPALDDLLPVSAQQRGMLLENLAHPGRGMHVEQFVATFAGPLEPAALEAAWSGLIARHETLRSGFIWRHDGEPLRVVHRQAAAGWQHLDWRADAGAESRIGDWLAVDAAAGFAGSAAPLRFATMRLDDERWLFVWTYHHALLDGWSVARLLAEVLEPASGKAAPASARDHARWLASRDREAAAAFWRRYLADAATPSLPGRRDAALEPGEGYADLCQTLDAARAEKLETLARRRRITPAMLAQGAWALTLAWASGQDDVVFASTVSGRPTEIEGSEAWVGLFINSLPLRLAVPAAGDAWRWLEQLGDNAAERSQYEWCAGGDIHAWSGLPLGRSLSDTLIIFENYPNTPQQPVAGGGARLVSVAGRGARTHFPVTLLIMPGDGWRCEFVCDNQYIPAEEAARLLDAFIRLLAALADEGAALDDVRAALPPQPPRLCRQPERVVQPPRTALELEIAKLWEDLFALSPIGADDNFFLLGGHSLLALDLMARLRARFGRRVPFTAFLAEPTVAGLARLLAGDELQGGVSLLPLADQGRPLYLMPGASGNPLAYLELAQALEGRYALIGAQPDMVDRGAALTIEAVAADLAQAIERRQPQGPVLLAGHSFGSAIAFETARLLSRQGRTVGALVLIDTPVPTGGDEFAGFGEIDWIVSIADAAGSYFGQPIDLAPEELEPLPSDARRALMLARFQAAGALPAGASRQVIDDLLATYQNSIAAFSAYRPAYWDGALSVIRSEQEHGIDDPTLGWGGLCREIGITAAAPGDHISMVASAHAAELAKRIVLCVDSALEAGQARDKEAAATV
ncbi:non-ribosomal peptide synthetase [Chromobacterium subtsugae]|uniref:non-ribosomal peptide synthetase n=1 Tax=Chromobacterium subtsugae TaxID=251747 RepID=UPI0006412FF3|nr:non-ribosomal peptide synthetase [Chromobacterium subtsugae]